MEHIMASPALYDTVPKEDYLGFFKHDSPDYDRVVKFNHYKKEDVARATGVSLSSVRYDEKMPQELVDRLKEWANLFNLVAEFFGGDAKKTELWFSVPNPMLGDIPPRDMIRIGRYKKLLSFVLNSRAENKSAGN
jgi:uncharacterized protein (DUF2384 family)